MILVHPDVFTRTETTHEAVVDAAEQFLFLIRDTNDRKLREAVQVVYHAGILQLVDLVEDDDGSRTVVLLKAVDEFVVRCGLPVDIDSLAEIIENLAERSEPGVVAPAVDVCGFDVENLFPESFGDELRDTSLTSAAGPSNDGRVGGFAVCDGLENAGEVVDFGVAMLNFPRDESSAEDASIADHLCLLDWLSGS